MTDRVERLGGALRWQVRHELHNSPGEAVQGRHWSCAAQGRAAGGDQAQVAPVDEVAVLGEAAEATAKPPRDPDPADVDGDGSQPEVGPCELDVRDAAHPAARDVDDLRVEDVARQVQLAAS